MANGFTTDPLQVDNSSNQSSGSNQGGNNQFTKVGMTAPPIPKVQRPASGYEVEVMQNRTGKSINPIQADRNFSFGADLRNNKRQDIDPIKMREAKKDSYITGAFKGNDFTTDKQGLTKEIFGTDQIFNNTSKSLNEINDRTQQYYDMQSNELMERLSSTQQANNDRMMSQLLASGMSPATASAIVNKNMQADASRNANALQDIAFQAQKEGIQTARLTEQRDYAEDLEQKQNLINLYNNSLADDNARERLGQMLQTMYPGDATVTAILDPEIASYAIDQAKIKRDSDNKLKSNDLILQEVDFLDQSSIDNLFDLWKESRYGGMDSYAERRAELQPASAEIIAEFTEKFGYEPDPTTAWMYDQYKKDIKAASAGEMMTAFENSLVTGDPSLLDPTMLEQLQGLSNQLATTLDGQDVRLGDLSGQFDGDLENGVFSIHFTGWDGEDYNADTYEQIKSEPLTQNLDKAWTDYVKRAQERGSEIVTRDQFREAIEEEARNQQFMFTTGELPDADIDVLVDSVFGNLDRLALGDFMVDAANLSDSDFDRIMASELGEPEYQLKEALLDSGFTDVGEAELFANIDADATKQSLREAGIVPGRTIYRGVDGQFYLINAVQKATDNYGDENRLVVFGAPLDPRTGKPGKTTVVLNERERGFDKDNKRIDWTLGDYDDAIAYGALGDI